MMHTHAAGDECMNQLLQAMPGHKGSYSCWVFLDADLIIFDAASDVRITVQDDNTKHINTFFKKERCWSVQSIGRFKVLHCFMQSQTNFRATAGFTDRHCNVMHFITQSAVKNSLLGNQFGGLINLSTVVSSVSGSLIFWFITCEKKVCTAVQGFVFHHISSAFLHFLFMVPYTCL